MKSILRAAFAIGFISSASLAQSPGISGWVLSDIRTSTLTEIQGVMPDRSGVGTTSIRKATKGLFIELKGQFSFASASRWGAPSLAVSEIKLSGISEISGESWSDETIAVGFDTPSGCVEHRFVDSRGTASFTRTINGQTVAVDINDGKLNIASGAPVPMCFVFAAPYYPRNMTLSFSETEVGFDTNGVGPQRITRQSIIVDEKVMSPRLTYRPKPTFPGNWDFVATGIFAVTIAENGAVKDLRVISSSNPIALNRSIDAIKTWRYQPTALNGVPLEVRTRITLSINTMRPEAGQ